MSKANGSTALAGPNGVEDAAGDGAGAGAGTAPDLANVASDGPTVQVLRTAVAVAYVPVALTEQLLARSQPVVYYAGVATLAAVGAIEWPVAGVVAAGVWVARHHPAGGSSR